MRCEVCGAEYSLAHNCGGPASAVSSSAPPPSATLVGYLRDALAILGLTVSVITRVAGDRRAFRYGASFFAVTFTVAMFIEISKELDWNEPLMLGFGMVFAAIAAVLAVPVFLGYFYAIHSCMRFIFGGKASYWELVRPMMLSSPILVFLAIPVLGDILGFWWSFSVLSWVGSTVYGVKKLRVRILLLFGGLGFVIILLGVLATLHLLLQV